MTVDSEKAFKDGYFSMQKGLPSQSKEIYKGFLISAGFLFSESKMIEDVPYDPHLYFEGEETTMSLRLFTNGYDVFHIPKIPVFHCYVDYSNLAKRPMHWNEDEDKDRSVKWTDLQAKSKKTSKTKLVLKNTFKYQLTTDVLWRITAVISVTSDTIPSDLLACS